MGDIIKIENAQKRNHSTHVCTETEAVQGDQYNQATDKHWIRLHKLPVSNA